MSFYFEPDLSAGSFRNTALAKELSTRISNSGSVDVITTMPNRYGSFITSAPEFEIVNNLKIHRIFVPYHRGRMTGQALAFLRFSFEAIKLVRQHDYDIVYASSSRLMSATLGSIISRMKNIPLYLDIRDIFVDTLSSVLSPKIVWFVLPLVKLIEKWSFKKASKINLVSEGFKQYFFKRYPEKSFSWFTNGIDKEFITTQEVKNIDPQSKIAEIVYAGNFGEGQGLHIIIPELAETLKGKVKFKLIGDGGLKKELLEALELRNIKNVEIIPPLSRKKIIEAYERADILFLHLNNYQALKVLPSKIFEYAASGKPIWAGVSGYPEYFLKTRVKNVALFRPGNVKRL